MLFLICVPVEYSHPTNQRQLQSEMLRNSIWKRREIQCGKEKFKEGCLALVDWFTFVRILTPALEDEYAAEPGNWPRFKPAMEAMLIMDPFLCASRMRLHTLFDTSHVPVRFVLNEWFHSSSDNSNGDFTVPARHTTIIKHHNFPLSVSYTF